MPAEEVTLITNITFVQYGDVRMECSAVIIESNVDSFLEASKAVRVRGFGPDGAWPVFTLWAKPGTTHEVRPAQDNSKLLMGQDGGTKPIFSGAILALSDGRSMYLNAQDGSKPLDIETGISDYEKLWRTLQKKANDYWTAPNMPHLLWAPPVNARAIERARRRR